MVGEARISLVEQAFWGQFKGSGYLVLPSGAARELVSLLGNTSLDEVMDLPAKELEMGTLLEVGNILIGACVGKLAELLDDTVTYSPPLVTVEGEQSAALAGDMWEPGTTAIVLKTVFRFNGRNVKGFLFLVTSQDSIQWLRTALAGFLGRHA
jgi:chemotaxis protein CheC